MQKCFYTSFSCILCNFIYHHHKQKGLQTEPWCVTTFSSKSFDHLPSIFAEVLIFCNAIDFSFHHTFPFPEPTKSPLLGHNQMLFLNQQKPIYNFLSAVLYISNICRIIKIASMFSRHEPNLNFIYLHHVSQPLLTYPFNYFHAMPQQLNTSAVFT